MAYCSNCGAEISADAKACSNCGAVIGEPAKETAVQNPYDHTAEFDPQDISDNKVYAIMAYLFDIIGLIIVAIIAKDSPYARFHLRESAKLTVVLYGSAILSCLLCWTCIVPIAGAILIAIVVVLHVISIVQVCCGKAVEPWLIRSFKFLH